MNLIKNKKIQKEILSSLFIITFFITPVFANAYILSSITCGYDCGYSDLLTLVNAIIDWIIKISIPISAGVFAWAGFKYMTSAVVDQKSQAREMMKKVLMGFVFILSAWVIVSTILSAIVNKSNVNTSVIPVSF